MNLVEMKIDFSKQGKPFKHFYNAIGYANTDYTYTEPTKKMYDYLSSYSNHFKYMRMHNILTCHGKGDSIYLSGEDYGGPRLPDDPKIVDNPVFSVDEKGELHCDWTYVDKVYDILMEHGIRPIVETISIPGCLRKSEELTFVPKDFNLWSRILKAFVTHLNERYGKEEVEHWYFEVWNEPDNQRFWLDSPESFFALYDYMEAAIHSINPNIKVGGPAVKMGEGGLMIFKRFLEHCAKELNYATGTFGTRVDFISVHSKAGWPEAYNPSTEYMFDALKDFCKIMKEYPEFENTEFFNDESDIVWNGNEGIWKRSWLNFRNTHYPPGFICKMVNTYSTVIEDACGANLSIVDSDNCHLQWEKFLFSGNRSQFTPLIRYPSTDIIKKPIFNSYVLLSRLGSMRQAVECSSEGYGVKFGALPTIDPAIMSMSIMVWNFEDGMEDDINDRQIRLYLEKVPFRGKYKLIHYRIDKEHSSSYGVWKSLGKPDAPSIDQIRKIREREGLELYSPVSDIILEENMDFELDMPMHSVSLLLFVPENMQKPEKPSIMKTVVEEGFNKNHQVFLKWKPCKNADFLYYRISRKAANEESYRVISDNTSVNTSAYTDMDVAKGVAYSYRIQSVNASYIESDFSECDRDGS